GAASAGPRTARPPPPRCSAPPRRAADLAPLATADGRGRERVATWSGPGSTCNEGSAMRNQRHIRRGAILPRRPQRLLGRSGDADEVALRVGETADDERSGHAVGSEDAPAAELLGTGERGLDIVDPDIEEV